MYLVDLPDEDNWLSGVGFQSDKRAAGTCPTVQDAEKVIAWLKEEPNDKREYLIELEDCKDCKAVQEAEQNPFTECDQCGWENK
ncbi:hypothetical protein D3C86_1092440 [compost metagenome]